MKKSTSIIGVKPQDHHRERKKTDEKKHFAKMKSRGGAYVQIEIGMMHVMK
jgi:hypothetical protein